MIFAPVQGRDDSRQPLPVQMEKRRYADNASDLAGHWSSAPYTIRSKEG